jgi:hypothetical protein
VFVCDLVTRRSCVVYDRTGTNVACRARFEPMAGVKQTLHLASEILPLRCASCVQWNLPHIFLRMTLQRPASKNSPWGNRYTSK